MYICIFVDVYMVAKVAMVAIVAEAFRGQGSYGYPLHDIPINGFYSPPLEKICLSIYYMISL